MIEYKLLKELEHNPSATQRTLAQRLNVSLGKINYLLTGLAQKGIIKAKKLKNNPSKIRWNYVLTPKGVKEKVRLTKNYLEYRMVEFEKLRFEIEEMKRELSD